MSFLWNPSEWLSGVADGVMGAMEQGIRTLSFSISTIIYKLIINLYNLFESLCTARILDSPLISEVSTRIGLILGLVMFFNVIFSFIKMLIDPNVIEDKEKGAIAIVKKTLIVIVMLGVSNFVFDTLYHVQSIVIKDHIISNLLLPYKISDDNLKNFGSILSEELMNAFYQLEDFSEADVGGNNTTINTCRSMVTAFRNQIINQGRFDLGRNCLNESIEVDIDTNSSLGTQTQEIFVVNYNWALCPLAGIVVVYLLFMYCLKVGVRMIQLTFLEIISPMAIVSYLSPKKDTMFNKWGKIYVSTYIDVFIRMAIINFVIFLIATIFAVNAEEGFVFWQSVGNPTDTYTKTFFLVVIILSLLTFAKKAPDLLKELLPSSASKLGFGASMKDIVGLQKGIGMVTGAATGAAVGFLGGRGIGAIGGIFRGARAGFGAKGIGNTIGTARKNQSDYNKRMANIRANGGSWLGSNIASVQKTLGMRTASDRYNDEKERLEKENAAYNQLAGYFDAAKKRAEGKIKEGKYKGSNTGQMAANAALQAEQRMEILKAQAGNLDKSSATYNTDMKAIQSEIAKHQKAYNRAMDIAIKEFINTSSDPVVNQNMEMAQGVINNNNSYNGFAGSVVTDYDTFDSANSKAKAQVATNTTALGRNAQAGKSARANDSK